MRTQRSLNERTSQLRREHTLCRKKNLLQLKETGTIIDYLLAYYILVFKCM